MNDRRIETLKALAWGHENLMPGKAGQGALLMYLCGKWQGETLRLSLEDLRAATGWQTGTIQRTLRALEARGLIHRVMPPLGRSEPTAITLNIKGPTDA